MKTHLLSLTAITRVAIFVGSAMIASVGLAQTAPPPSLGEETKGVPAIEDLVIEDQAAAAQETTSEEVTEAENSDDEKKPSFFGKTTIVETKRENGQVSSIELKHSNAPPQYIEETDSDGNIKIESNDLEDTPNLPKWKLGSW